jgi:two-component system, NtrC family, response regulator HydG
VMTAFAMEELVDQGIQEGVYTVLRKPFEVSELGALVRRAARNGAVLVIDDKPEVSHAIMAALESAGIPAIEASSAEEALKRLESGNVDTCLVDLVMPGVEGAELCRQIRARSGEVVLLAMTGYNVPQKVLAATQAGTYTCLRKPFEVEALLRTVARARREL